MYYETYGTEGNPVLLLLHGAAAKDTFCHLYRPLSQRYFLVVPHLPGGGEAAGKSYDPEQVTRALAELTDQLGDRPIGVTGHSLGAQLALRLLCARPERFRCGVLLSPWVCPKEGTVRLYCQSARYLMWAFRWRWLVELQGRYWGYDKNQQAAMARDAKQLTLEQYQSFFAQTTRLSELPEYEKLTLPMLAVCGSGELGEMKDSVHTLARENPNCQAVILPGASHDFPMRRPEALLRMLEDFLEVHLHD